MVRHSELEGVKSLSLSMDGRSQECNSLSWQFECSLGEAHVRTKHGKENVAFNGINTTHHPGALERFVELLRTVRGSSSNAIQPGEAEENSQRDPPRLPVALGCIERLSNGLGSAKIG